MTRAAATKSARPARTWTRLPDAELLQLRFCDLDLKLVDTPLERRLNRVHSELEKRGIGFRPHMWLSEEWFSRRMASPASRCRSTSRIHG